LTSASASFVSLARKSSRCVIGTPSNNMSNIPSAITSAFDGVLAAVVDDAHGDDAKVTTTACLATSSQRAP